MDAKQAYEAALIQYKWEFTKFIEVRQQYRRRLVGDSEFLAAKAALAEKEAFLDSKEQALKNEG